MRKSKEKVSKKAPKKTKLVRQYLSVFKKQDNTFYGLGENHSLEQPSIYKPTQSIAIFGNTEEALTF